MDKEEIKNRLHQALQDCEYRADIRRLGLFGSYVAGRPRKNSDVDLLIEFEPGAVVGFFKLARIQRYLRQSIGRKVDLVTPDALSKYIRDEVLSQAELIYEK
jgi:hypothetical protein